jgi:hypothetical protein
MSEFRKAAPEEYKHEEEFRAALVKYIEAIDFATPGAMLTDFMILTVERDLNHPNMATTAYVPCSTTLMVTQMGMVRYVDRLLETRIARGSGLYEEGDSDD